MPFCAYENMLEARENIADWRAIPVGIRADLCLFVPAKIQVPFAKLLKRFGVPLVTLFEPLATARARIYKICLEISIAPLRREADSSAGN